jgi:hypothetical protein
LLVRPYQQHAAIETLEGCPGGAQSDGANAIPTRVRAAFSCCSRRHEVRSTWTLASNWPVAHSPSLRRVPAATEEDPVIKLKNSLKRFMSVAAGMSSAVVRIAGRNFKTARHNSSSCSPLAPAG